MQRDQQSADGADVPHEQQPLIIENVEILDLDHRLQGRPGHRHRRTNSSSEILLAATAAPRQPPSTELAAQPFYAQPPPPPPPRYTSSSYGSQHHGPYPCPAGAPAPYRDARAAPPPPRPASASPTYPPTYQHGPPPYPSAAARSSKRTATTPGGAALDGAPARPGPPPPVVDPVATLSAEDIERAFQAALQAQQPEYYQMEPPATTWPETGDHTYLHPLKREAPPRHQPGGATGHYGSIPTTIGAVRSRRSASPVNRAQPPSGAPPSGRHQDQRRVRSNSPARPGISRINSADPLLQRGVEVPLAYPSQRRRSLDAVNSQSPLGGRKSVFFPPIPPQPQQHRRHASAADSVRSDVSLMSYRSDIRKSTYFQDYDSGTGKATLNFPNARVHLVMSPALEPGRVYGVPVPASVYDDYFLALQEQEDGSLGFDFDLGNLNFCGCDCAQCAACRGKTELPPRFYALGVRDDLYRRVLDEVCRARGMPCGLFFCGFHEDVSRPSILLAVAVVAALLVAMVVAACYVAG